MVEFDADPNIRNGMTHYDYDIECWREEENKNPTHCTAVCIDGVHINMAFKTPFDALNWALSQDGCDSKNHVFFRYEL